MHHGKGRIYDVVFDAVGTLSLAQATRVLAPDGVYIRTDPGAVWSDAVVSRFTKRAKLGIVNDQQAYLLELVELPEHGGYRAVIDRSARAHRTPRRKVATTMSTPDTSIPRFHLAMPVDDLAAARHFYGEVLGLEQGRSSDRWVDWNLHGHQFVTHLAPRGHRRASNPVDGHDVPVPHFGVLLNVPEFHTLADRLRAAGTAFVIEPYVRFEGEAGEQWTMFLLDPAGNALEFKAFADDSQVFAG